MFTLKVKLLEIFYAMCLIIKLHGPEYNFFAIINRYFNDSALRLGTLMWDLGNKMQLCIQGYNKRPYGVGLLVAGYDDLGPHIYQVHMLII